ncbi:hypothetical protein, partial [Thermococcus sp. GR7]
WVNTDTEAFFLFMLFTQAITDYVSYSVEVIIGGLAFVGAFWLYVKVAWENPLLSVLFGITVVTILLRQKFSILLSIPLVAYSEWLMLHSSTHELILGYAFVAGATIGLVDNHVIGRSGSGDILITTNVF